MKSVWMDVLTGSARAAFASATWARRGRGATSRRAASRASATGTGSVWTKRRASGRGASAPRPTRGRHASRRSAPWTRTVPPAATTGCATTRQNARARRGGPAKTASSHRARGSRRPRAPSPAAGTARAPRGPASASAPEATWGGRARRKRARATKRYGCDHLSHTIG